MVIVGISYTKIDSIERQRCQALDDEGWTVVTASPVGLDHCEPLRHICLDQYLQQSPAERRNFSPGFSEAISDPDGMDDLSHSDVNQFLMITARYGPINCITFTNPFHPVLMRNNNPAKSKVLSLRQHYTMLSSLAHENYTVINKRTLIVILNVLDAGDASTRRPRLMSTEFRDPIDDTKKRLICFAYYPMARSHCAYWENIQFSEKERSQLHPVHPFVQIRLGDDYETASTQMYHLETAFAMLKDVKRIPSTLAAHFRPDQLSSTLDKCMPKEARAAFAKSPLAFKCHVAVEPTLSEVNKPLQYGLFASRNIKKGEAITYFGGLRMLGSHHGGGSAHRIPTADKEQFTWDATLLRRAMVSFVPTTQQQLNGLIRQTASDCFEYDRDLIRDPALRFVFEYGIGYFANDAGPGNKQNATIERHADLDKSQFDRCVLIASHDLKANEQIFVSGREGEVRINLNPRRSPRDAMLLYVDDNHPQSGYGVNAGHQYLTSEQAQMMMRAGHNIRCVEANDEGTDVPASGKGTGGKGSGGRKGKAAAADVKFWHRVDDELIQLTLSDAAAQAAEGSIVTQLTDEEYAQYTRTSATFNVASSSSTSGPGDTNRSVTPVNYGSATPPPNVVSDAIERITKIATDKDRQAHLLFIHEQDEARKKKVANQQRIKALKLGNTEAIDEQSQEDLMNALHKGAKESSLIATDAPTLRPPISPTLFKQPLQMYQTVGDECKEVEQANTKSVELKISFLFEMFQRLQPQKNISHPGLMFHKASKLYNMDGFDGRFFGAVHFYQNEDAMGPESDPDNSYPLLPIIHVPILGLGDCGILAAQFVANPEMMMQHHRAMSSGQSDDSSQIRLEAADAVECRKRSVRDRIENE